MILTLPLQVRMAGLEDLVCRDHREQGARPVFAGTPDPRAVQDRQEPPGHPVNVDNPVCPDPPDRLVPLDSAEMQDLPDPRAREERLDPRDRVGNLEPEENLVCRFSHSE